MKRVSSGIGGLDDMMEGGFPEGDNILLTGPPGSGKTTLALQFLVNGILKSGQKGLYIEAGEKLDKIIEHVERFGWDLRRLQDEGRLLMLSPQIRPEEGEDPMQWITRKEVHELVDQFKPERVAVDSLSLLLQHSREPGGHRRGVQRVIDSFHMDCTTLFVSELAHVYPDRLDYTTEEFIADGIINMYYQRDGNVFERFLAILKMRGTNHSRRVTHFTLEDKAGIIVHSEIFERQ